MSEFQVSADGDELDPRLERLGVFLSDLRSFWPSVVPLFIGWMRGQFETEGEFAGARWAGLSPAYAARKRRSPNLRDQILQATGALKQAASRPSRSVTPTTLTLTVEDPKLPWLQEGTGTMPARPLIFGDDGMPARARAELDAAADRYVADLLRRI